MKILKGIRRMFHRENAKNGTFCNGDGVEVLTIFVMQKRRRPQEIWPLRSWAFFFGLCMT